MTEREHLISDLLWLAGGDRDNALEIAADALLQTRKWVSGGYARSQPGYQVRAPKMQRPVVDDSWLETGQAHE